MYLCATHFTRILWLSSVLWANCLATSYLDEVRKFEVVEPIHISGRNKRDLSTKRLDNQNEHLDEARFEFHGYGKHFRLHIYKNEYLLPSTYLNIYQNPDGSEEVKKGIVNCYYHGHLGNEDTTSVVMDTCNGIKGLIQDEDGEQYFIEPHTHYNKSYGHHNKHVFYKTKDIIMRKKAKCGNEHSYNDTDGFHFQSGSEPILPLLSDHFRKRRATTVKYIEVIAVIDKRNYNKLGSIAASQKRAVEVMNYVDAVYKTMTTRVALVAVIVWNNFDISSVSPNAGETLSGFRKFTSEVLFNDDRLHFDNAELLSGVDFTGALVGLAGVGVMCSRGSAAINQDHNSNPAVSANTIAHEMGHNLGMIHNTNGCKCPKDPCVMGAYAPHQQVMAFTSCSSDTYNKRLDRGEMPCLYDYPGKLFGNPKCGNGFLEKGEQCDCGSAKECADSGADKCCDPAACTLQSTAKCATGPCCKDCQFKSQGTLCRDKFNEECDLQEYCVGNSSECGVNYFVKDGKACNDGTAFCYQGFCRSVTTQCKVLWGPNAIKAEDVCYQQNSKASNPWGNCGKDTLGRFIPCAKKDQLCGKLQCKGNSKTEPLPSLPIIGSGRSRKTVTYYIGKTSIPCIMGITSLGGDLDDPTIAKDGTKCGVNDFCVDHLCKNISKQAHIKQCNTTCLNGGICNNNGNCHCLPGFACPNCEFAGPGGSLDSGQGCINQDNCGCLTPLVKGMLILFLLVLPLIGLIAYLCYRYRAKISSRLASYRAGKTTRNQENVTSSKQLQKQQLNTGGPKVGQGHDNPYITYSHGSSPAPPPKNISNKPDKPNKLPPISGSSPRPGKLPQIDAYNKIDQKAGSTPAKKWPPPSTQQPYK